MRYLSLVMLLLLCGGTLFWTGCAEEQNPFTEIEEEERALVHLLNVSARYGGVDVNLESFQDITQVASNLQFQEGWPRNGYASLLVTAGGDSVNEQRNLYMHVLEHGRQNKVVPSLLMNFPIEQKTSLILVDSSDTTFMVRTLDFPLAVTDTASVIRFMNLSQATISATLRIGATSFVIRNINFLNYSSFRYAPLGIHTAYFVDDVSGEVLDSIPNLELRPGRNYNFFLGSKGGRVRAGYEFLE